MSSRLKGSALGIGQGLTGGADMGYIAGCEVAFPAGGHGALFALNLDGGPMMLPSLMPRPPAELYNTASRSEVLGWLQLQRVGRE